MIYDVHNLTFSYDSSERKVLDGASLTLGEGEILSILGPNGAGKTTLLNCMAGLLEPTSGTIKVCGQDITHMKKKDFADKVGYVPQSHTPAFNYSVMDFVIMGAAPRVGMMGKPSKEDEALCEDVLSKLRIDHLKNRSYMNISGGERQQVMIARAIVQQPKVILFDEPTSHLDYGNQHKILSLVKNMAEEGYSIIITTHNPDHALLLGDKAAIVEANGRITSGKSNEIITEEKLREIYNVDLRLLPVDELNRTACLVPKL